MKNHGSGMVFVFKPYYLQHENVGFVALSPYEQNGHNLNMPPEWGKIANKNGAQGTPPNTTRLLWMDFYACSMVKWLLNTLIYASYIGGNQAVCLMDFSCEHVDIALTVNATLVMDLTTNAIFSSRNRSCTLLNYVLSG